MTYPLLLIALLACGPQDQEKSAAAGNAEMPKPPLVLSLQIEGGKLSLEDELVATVRFTNEDKMPLELFYPGLQEEQIWRTVSRCVIYKDGSCKIHNPPHVVAKIEIEIESIEEDIPDGEYELIEQMLEWESELTFERFTLEKDTSKEFSGNVADKVDVITLDNKEQYIPGRYRAWATYRVEGLPWSGTVKSEPVEFEINR